MEEQLFEKMMSNDLDCWTSKRHGWSAREAYLTSVLDLAVDKMTKDAQARNLDRMAYEKTIEDLKEENSRLREQVKNLQPQQETFMKRQEKKEDAVNDIYSQESEGGEEPCDSSSEDETTYVSNNDFMAKVISSELDDYDKSLENGPWNEFIRYDNFLERENSDFREPVTISTNDYARVYAINPQLCPHSIYTMAKKEFLDQFKSRREPVPDLPKRFLKPIISEIFVQFPFEENMIVGLRELFQGKLNDEDIRKLIPMVIPLPPLMRPVANEGAVQLSNAVPIYVPDDAVFSGAVFAELVEDDDDDDDDSSTVDYYVGIAPQLNATHYKIPDLKVPRYTVEFFNGHVEDFILSDLIPIEVIQPGTPLNWRLKDGGDKVVTFQFLEKSSPRPTRDPCLPIWAYFVHALDGEISRRIPLAKLCLRSETAYQILKKIRCKLLSRNKTSVQSENILPEGTKRRRSERFDKPPTKRIKKTSAKTQRPKLQKKAEPEALTYTKLRRSPRCKKN